MSVPIKRMTGTMAVETAEAERGKPACSKYATNGCVSRSVASPVRNTATHELTSRIERRGETSSTWGSSPDASIILLDRVCTGTEISDSRERHPAAVWTLKEAIRGDNAMTWRQQLLSSPGVGCGRVDVVGQCGSVK